MRSAGAYDDNRASDEQSFRGSLVAILPRLRRFGIGLAGSLDEADDLVQAACTRALERSKQFAPGSRLDSWLYRIMQTIWLNRITAKHHTAREDADELERLVDDAGARQMEARVMLRQIDELVATLPASQRVVVLLVCAEEHSYQETADILDIPVGTVMSRLARARATIAERTASVGRRAHG